MRIVTSILVIAFMLTLLMHRSIILGKKRNKKGSPFVYGVDGRKFFHKLPVPFFKTIFTTTTAISCIISIIGGGFFLIFSMDWLMEDHILFSQNSFSTFLAQNTPQFILWVYAGIIISITIIQVLIIFLSGDYFSPYKIKIDTTTLELRRHILFWKKSILQIDFSKPYVWSINQDVKNLGNDRITYCFSQNKKGIGISFPKVWNNTNSIEKSIYFSESFTSSDVFYQMEPNREFEKIKSLLEKPIQLLLKK